MIGSVGLRDREETDTGHQGTGILQTGREYDIVNALDEELGLRELRAKVNGKAGITEDSTPNRFSINAEFCYGSRSIEIMRKYLDSGVLEDYLHQRFFKTDRCLTGGDAQTVATIGACAISLGSQLPEKLAHHLELMMQPAYARHMKEKNPNGAMTTRARLQLKEALSAYRPGTRYSYSNKTFLEASMSRMLPIKGAKVDRVFEAGSSKIIVMKLPNGQTLPQVIGPPSDEEVGQTPIHPNHVCGGCGEAQGEKGGELQVCSRCRDRKFCSRECQKKAWKTHKIICSQPAARMSAFLDSIPLDFVDDGAKSMEAFRDL